jgi:hypothetical protein
VDAVIEATPVEFVFYLFLAFLVGMVVGAWLFKKEIAVARKVMMYDDWEKRLK